MNRFNILAIICSAFIGALAMSLVRECQLPTSGLISALTTVVVGWWIHSAVRRRGELDRVPIDYLSNLNLRVDELVSVCLGTATKAEDRLVHLGRLSNEIHWLRAIAKELPPEQDRLRNELTSRYVDFKRPLTEEFSSVDWQRASNASHELRMTALKVQWSLCQNILSRKKNTDIFG